MSQYDRQIRSAARVIAKKGQLVTWRKLNNVADPAKPWKATVADPAPADYQVKIVFLRPNGGFANALYHLIKGTEAPSGAPRGLMAAVNFTPDMNDQVIRNGQVLIIKSFDVVAPGGDPILYDIQFA